MRLWGDVARANARRFGDKAALVGPRGRPVSFAEYDARVNRLNHALGRRGLVKGSRVALLSRNRPEYVEGFGVAKSGMIIVPLNWRLTAAELSYQLHHCRPEAVIADAAHRAVIDGLRPELDFVRLFVGLDGAAPGWSDYETLLAESAANEPTADLDPGETICLMYTSGTTGRPKGVELSHHGVLRNAVAQIEALGLGDRDIGLSAMPLFHVGGMWYHLFPSFMAGGTVHILAEFDPASVLAVIAERSVTQLHLVPTMIGALLAAPEIAAADLRSLRLLFYAASSIPAELLLRAMERFGREVFLQSYGSTESGAVACLTPADHLLTRQPGRESLLRACGRALPGVEIRILDAGGRELPAGRIGEVAVRSDRSMRRYWNDPAATAAVRDDGWLRMGDLGHLDEDGYLHIVDRKNDMIVSGGENVYPREVEDVLYGDPAILEVAVFGIPDAKWVEQVAAAIILRPGAEATADDIIARARQQLAGYKCPKTIFFVEHLPKSAAGKVLRRELRARFGARG